MYKLNITGKSDAASVAKMWKRCTAKQTVLCIKWNTKKLKITNQNYCQIWPTSPIYSLNSWHFTVHKKQMIEK